MGEFILKKIGEGQFVFHLKANNRQTICTSQVYTSMVSCRHGVGSCRKNCASHVEDQTLQNPEKLKHPKYELYQDKAEQFRFRLKAPNGRIVAVSQGYTTKGAAKNGIESIMNNAPDATLFYDVPEEEWDELVTDDMRYISKPEDETEDLSIFDEPESAPAVSAAAEEVVVQETVIETVVEDDDKIVVEEVLIEEVIVEVAEEKEEPAPVKEVTEEPAKEPVKETAPAEDATPAFDVKPKKKKKKGMQRMTAFQRLFGRRRR